MQANVNTTQTPNLRPFTTRVFVAGQWIAESFTTAEQALDQRDALLDAGFTEVKVDGLPSYFGPTWDYDGDPADDDELIVLPK
jgi:hypothetical protein